MSRYTGPRLKKVRALGCELPGLTRKSAERRPYPPGQHGQARKKLSEYAVRLREKQKLRLNYGVSERQLRSIVDEARRQPGETGASLLALLESRLDNVVWRAGFAATIPAARQLINHGHLLVNGRRCDIASARVSVGDTLKLDAALAQNPHVVEALSRAEVLRPGWLSVNEPERAISVVGEPDRESVPLKVETHLVVEFYARSL